MNDKNNPPQMMQPEHYQEDIEEEGRVTDDSNLGALVQLNASEINQQIITARAYPRSITLFRRQMRELVTLDEEVAQSCLYALKRGGKVIEGPSARFAEVAVQMWGNSRAGARVIDIGEQFITAQGAFYDLEKNMAVSYEVLRRITDRTGERFGDDMIGVTGNAACSIAIRNAVLKGIPKAFWNDAYQQARGVAFGKGETIANKRAAAIKAFQAYGVEPAQIYGLLGVKGADDVTIDHLILLGGIHQSIKEGEQTPEEAFAVENMRNPGEATPPRPSRSEFARTAAKAQNDKSAPKTSLDPTDPANASAITAAVTAADQKPVEQTKAKAEPAVDDKAARRAQEWADQKADWAKELGLVVKVREVADLRDAVDEQLETAEEKAEWSKLCDQRRDAIMDKTKASKGK